VRAANPTRRLAFCCVKNASSLRKTLKSNFVDVVYQAPGGTTDLIGQVEVP
jgi:hypothetical protein